MMDNGKEIVKTGGFKRQKKDVVKQDRISSLPDSILVHILSFLPTEEAIKMVIFPRFGHLWTSIHTLDFDQCPYNVYNESEVMYGVFCKPMLDESFLNFIRRALILHHRPTIHKFRLRFLFYYQYYGFEEYPDEDEEYRDAYLKEKRVANEIDTWIRFAIMREVNVLDLDFLAYYNADVPGYISYKLPDFVFTSDFLTELKLVFCDVEPQGKIHMRSLRSLFLKKIGLFDEKLNDIIHGCPLLEDLYIIECYDFEDLNFTSPNVKSLTVVVLSCHKMNISCPNLLSLNLSFYESTELIDLSSLVRATIDINSLSNLHSRLSKIMIFFQKLRHVKVTLSHKTVLVFAKLAVENLPCPINGWKSIVLKTRLTESHMQGISSVLYHSPSMEDLTIIWEPCSSTPYNAEENVLGSTYEFDETGYWSSQKFTFHCLEHHLKHVKLLGFLTERRVVQLIEFLLKNALVLEKMVITFKQNMQADEQELLEFFQKLSSLHRASPSAVILFS